MTRIADGVHLGHASWSRAYAIGYHSCTACGKETPGPPQSVLDGLALEQSTIPTVWPFEHWEPAGWLDIPSYGHTCPACTRAVMSVLGHSAAGRSAAGRSYGPLTIVETAIARAITLANDALLAGNPPPPEPYSEGIFGDGYRYKHPGTSYVYRTIADYHMGWMREHLRQIRSVLTGKQEPTGE